jgi:hypothetical protein
MWGAQDFFSPKNYFRLGTVAHTCNCTSLGGRDQDCGSRPALAKSSWEPVPTSDWMWWHVPAVIPAT